MHLRPLNVNNFSGRIPKMEVDFVVGSCCVGDLIRQFFYSSLVSWPQFSVWSLLRAGRCLFPVISKYLCIKTRWDKPQQHVIKQGCMQSRGSRTAETCLGVQAIAGSMSLRSRQCQGVAFGKDATGRCSQASCCSGQMVVIHFTARSNRWGCRHYLGFMCQQMTKHLIFKSV